MSGAKRLVLIGPTYPFRGGIAHYTTLLCRTLRQKHEVKFISFTRQYPKLLFPGKSDRDTSHSPVRVDEVDYLIDSLNPLTWRAAAKAIIEYRPEKVILPWWVAFWMPQFRTILKLMRRRIEPEVVFICHNVVEHESSAIKKRLTRMALSLGDRFITHSREETLRLQQLLGQGVNVVTAFLPSFAELSRERYSKRVAKAELALSGEVLLFFGFVRPYKGLGVLLEAMPRILREKQVTLLVVGEFWKDKGEYLAQIERLGIGPHVRLVDEYVPNEAIGLYFAAADLVVQPYLSASGSGISQIAYGFDRPVIATKVGSLPEVVEEGQNGWLVEPNNPQMLAQVILLSLEPRVLEKVTAGAARTKEKFSWEKMAEIVVGENRPETSPGGELDQAK